MLLLSGFFSFAGVEQRDETPGKGRAVSVEGSLFEHFLEARLSIIDQKEPGWLLDGIDEIPFDAVEAGYNAIRTCLFPDKAHQQFILKLAGANDMNGSPSQTFDLIRRVVGFAYVVRFNKLHGAKILTKYS
jgi:hypothetical protein